MQREPQPRLDHWPLRQRARNVPQAEEAACDSNRVRRIKRGCRLGDQVGREQERRNNQGQPRRGRHEGEPGKGKSTHEKVQASDQKERGRGRKVLSLEESPVPLCTIRATARLTSGSSAFSDKSVRGRRFRPHDSRVYLGTIIGPFPEEHQEAGGRPPLFPLGNIDCPAARLPRVGHRERHVMAVGRWPGCCGRVELSPGRVG